MKKTLAVCAFVATCGCSASLIQADSAWAGSLVPAGAGEYMMGQQEDSGGGGRIAARMGMSIYAGAEDKVDPRLTIGASYIMAFGFGDVEVGLDMVPDMADWFNNVYYNLRGDYVYWVGESGLALTGGMGFFIENNTEFDGNLDGSFFVHLDIGALYLISLPSMTEFDVRLALQLPMGGDKLNVGSVILLAANYAF